MARAVCSGRAQRWPRRIDNVRTQPPDLFDGGAQAPATGRLDPGGPEPACERILLLRLNRRNGAGPNFWTFDLRLTRQFGVGENRSLQLTFEAFDLLNRANFSSANNTVGMIGPFF